MKDYTLARISLTPFTEDAADLLAAFLADADFESFQQVPPEENDNSHTGHLLAYIDDTLFEPNVVKSILQEFPMQTQLEVEFEKIQGTDWNQEWERNYFQPIEIEGKCVVHSTFHKDVPHAEYDIIIDPKMAFGTGHHATTCMMIRHLLSMDLRHKKIIDMGTGTGILSILAAMRGADDVTGIEIDPGACDNARENVALNNVRVNLIQGDSAALAELQPADIFLANINRNIILADLARYVKALRKGGVMIFSGFYKQDIPLIERAANRLGLILDSQMEDPEGWVAVKFHS